MFDKPSIAATRIERQLTEASWNNVLDFAEELETIDRYFTPEDDDNIDLSILSSREFALSYRNSPDHSKIRALNPNDYQLKLEDDMLQSPHFNKRLTSRVEDVSLIENRGNVYLGLILSCGILVDERKCAVNSLRHLTRYPLSWDAPKIILGKTDAGSSNNRARRIQDKAHYLFESGKFDIEKLHFYPGTVQNHTIELFD